MLAGTALGGAGVTALSGDLGTASGILASATVLPYITVRMIANPAFTRWLVGMETFGKGAARTALVGRLGAIAQANPEIRDDVLKLQSVLSSPDQGR